MTPGQGIRYTVPVTIDLGNIEEDVHVRFRVGAVYKKVTIKLMCGDKELTSKRRTIVVPSEMEDVILRKSILEEVDGDIRVEMTGGGL